MRNRHPRHCDSHCSWRQTPATLIALGYDVPIPARDATVSEKLAAERVFCQMRHQAWVDGKIRLCTRRAA